MPETPEVKAGDTPETEPDAHLGAVEGDRPEDPKQDGDRNLPALDEQGLPRDRDGICEDVLGANEDRSQG
jgi:hypothetical protein